MGLFSGILLWSDLSNPFNWFLIFIVASFGTLGAYDDLKKIKGKSSAGLTSKTKFMVQILIAAIGILILTYFANPVDLKNLYILFYQKQMIYL